MNWRALAERIYRRFMEEGTMMGEVDISENDAITLIEDELNKFEAEKIVRIYRIEDTKNG